jgi:glutathione S-transferase
MCRYIAEKASSALIPSDIRDRARAEQWISVETSNFTAPAMKFIYQYVFKREQTAETLQTAGAQLDTALGIMDKQLAQTPFIACGSFSLADICFMPYIEYAINTPAKDHFAKHAHVSAWWSKISERPTWRKAVGR